MNGLLQMQYIDTCDRTRRLSVTEMTCRKEGIAKPSAPQPLDSLTLQRSHPVVGDVNAVSHSAPQFNVACQLPWRTDLLRPGYGVVVRGLDIGNSNQHHGLYHNRQMKDQSKKVANLKHKEQVEKKKNAQLMEEARKREDNINESSQQLQVGSGIDELPSARALSATATQMKDQSKKVANLKHKEQVEKKKNAQLMEEARKREDNINESSQQLQHFRRCPRNDVGWFYRLNVVDLQNPGFGTGVLRAPSQSTLTSEH
ncbi:UNVERIFIED_CONTAM: hypothetical protein FKN15_060487 [Acipenser sinensis]